MHEIIVYVLLANGVLLDGPGSRERCANLAAMEARFAQEGKPIPAASRDGRLSHVVKWWCEYRTEQAGPTS